MPDRSTTPRSSSADRDLHPEPAGLDTSSHGLICFETVPSELSADAKTRTRQGGVDMQAAGARPDQE